MSKPILLNAFHMNCVAHQSMGLWRHPRDRSRDYRSIEYWLRLARTLERGAIDGIFLADVSGVYDVFRGSPDAAIRNAAQIPANDPFCVVPAMAAVTKNLCFGVTGSIPYEPPYAFARRISTLDHLTDGRLAWNVVTGYLESAARGAGQAGQTSHDTRYDIAEDYMAAVYALWEGSWEDDAVVVDREHGIFADPAKVHRVQHDGPYFRVDGIHLCEPSPQRTPVIFQAGSSTRGQAFAARHAECVFAVSASRKEMAGLVRRLRADAVAAGREPDALRIFPLIGIVTGETDAEAAAKLDGYRACARTEGALALLSGWTGFDFGTLDLDARAENVRSEAIQSLVVRAGARTVREWAEFLCIGGAAVVFSGSPATVVDEMEQWMDDTGVDGFNVAYTVVPECIDDLVDLVVPELRRRGRCRSNPVEATMRRRLFGHGDRVRDTHPAAAHRRTPRDRAATPA